MGIVEDRVAAKLYREKAQAWRATACNASNRRARDAALRLAEEYEWRASSLEAAMSLAEDVTPLRQAS